MSFANVPSKFFHGGGDSSTESSSDDEALSSGAEEEDKNVKQDDSNEDSNEDASDNNHDSSDSEESKMGANQFLRGKSDSDESDEEVRAKVKSAKRKRLDELESSIKRIENGQKNGDWTLISNGMS